MKTFVPLTLVVLLLVFTGYRVWAERLVMCVYTSWSSYRDKPFYPEHINPEDCTHLIFAFADMDNTYAIQPMDERDLESDTQNANLYTRLNNLKKKKPTLKTLLAVGGASVSPIRFSEMSVSSDLREIFVQSCVNFLKDQGFDGLLLDWEFPVKQDKEDFTLLVKELRTAFQKQNPNLLLAVAVGKNSSLQLEAYDVPSINENVNYIIVLAYDFHGPWESVTGQSSALYSSDTKDGSLSVYALVENWVWKGASAGKIILGMATYGRTFKLAFPTKFKVGDPANGRGLAGHDSSAAGYLTYCEICRALKKDTIGMFDDVSMTPYAFSRDEWISYDDPYSLRHKLMMIIGDGLAGAAIWSVDADDFEGESCGQGKFPLTRVISGCLINGTNCTAAKGHPPRKMTMMCYYTNWSQFRESRSFYPEDIDPFLCTHLLFANAKIVESSIEPSVWNDVTNTEVSDGLYTKFNNLKKKNPKLKTLLTVGGFPDDARNFSEMASSSYLRSNFISEAISILRQNGFDGLDIGWHYLTGGERDYNTSDKENFVTLLRELNDAFNQEALEAEKQRPRLLLTAVVGAPYDNISGSYNVPEVSKFLDFVILKAFDLRGPEMGETGHSSALYASSTDKRNLTVSGAANNWMKLGARRERFLIGLPFFGVGFQLTDPKNHGLGAAVSGPGQQSKVSGERGCLTYFEVCDAVLGEGYTIEFDNVAKVPFAYKGDQWISFDSGDSIRFKLAWLVENGFAGATVFSMDMDDFDGKSLQKGNYPLTRLVNDCLMKGLNCEPISGNVVNPDVFETITSDADVSARSTSLCLVGVVTGVVLRT